MGSGVQGWCVLQPVTIITTPPLPGPQSYRPRERERCKMTNGVKFLDKARCGAGGGMSVYLYNIPVLIFTNICVQLL